MDQLFKIILYIHIAFGALSLIVFWIPVIVKKGGDIHNKAGKVYVFTIWVVVITATLLSLINLYNGLYIAAAFLGFLGVITGHPLWYGIVILKHKKKLPIGVQRMNLFLNWVLFLGGLGLVIWSMILKVQGQAILLLVFGIIGLSSALPLLFKPKMKSHWIAEHIEGLLGTGIAAYTAFFAFGGSRLFGHIFTEQWVIIPWILPTIIGVFGIKFYKRKYIKNEKSVLRRKNKNVNYA